MNEVHKLLPPKTNKNKKHTEPTTHNNNIAKQLEKASPLSPFLSSPSPPLLG